MGIHQGDGVWEQRPKKRGQGNSASEGDVPHLRSQSRQRQSQGGVGDLHTPNGCVGSGLSGQGPGLSWTAPGTCTHPRGTGGALPVTKYMQDTCPRARAQHFSFIMTAALRGPFASISYGARPGRAPGRGSSCPSCPTLGSIDTDRTA